MPHQQVKGTYAINHSLNESRCFQFIGADDVDATEELCSIFFLLGFGFLPQSAVVSIVMKDS